MSESISTQVKTNQWTKPDASVFHSEHILNFSSRDNGNESISVGSKRPPSKQLACKRCHAQKLRCVRQSPNERVCDRCLGANVDCIARQLQRMGRPVDHSNNSSNSVRSHHKSRNGGASRKGGTATASVSGFTRSHTRNSDCGSTLSTGRSTTRQESTGINIMSASVSFNDSDIPKDNSNRGNNSNSNSNSTNTTQFTPTSYTTSNFDVWSSWPSPTELTPFADPLATCLEDPTPLLPNFDEFPAALIPFGIDIAAFEPDLNSTDTTNLPPLSDHTLGDPVEQISKLHLELYQCFTSVKAVEKIKQEKLRDISRQVGEVDTSWLQHLFRTTERFIDALTSYVGSNQPKVISTITSVDTIGESREVQQTDTIVEVDTATGLMIMSCYMRLLQIFEVVVFVIETYRNFDCPGSYVEIQFGSFIPKTNKALSARLLGQYVIHLLDAISKAVDKVISSRQPYARAIADSRKAEVKLKERISTSLY